MRSLSLRYLSSRYLSLSESSVSLWSLSLPRPLRSRHAQHALTALLLALVAAPSAAREEVRPLPALRASSIPNCANGPPIVFGAEDRRVQLDAVDVGAVAAAVGRRYPVLERDGLAPDAIVLWRKPGSGWLYVTMLVNPSKPVEACFTATFVAQRFELTGRLLVKYFGAGIAQD
ncbi:MAG: hypothetical protein ABIV63_07150 [Caldimonas sp.]